MHPDPRNDLFSPAEIAHASGASIEQAIAIVGRADALVPYAEAVRTGRALRRANAGEGDRGSASLFASVIGRSSDAHPPAGVTLALSSTIHVGLLAGVLFMTTLGLAPRAASLATDRIEDMRLVFVAKPGPGGGGGGGGLRQPASAPKAMRQGTHAISSPLPRREMPKAIVPAPTPPEPKPQPIKAESLPVVVAPVIPVPADPRDRAGVLASTPAETTSRGPGSGGGVGTGTGTGVGEGDGSGIGPGSGGGTGGGPYRPGSGIDPPRLVHEVKADYTEEARQRGVAGEVVLEIVVRRDGTVGDTRVLQGLGHGLDERAVNAVRQWRFSPARRMNAPVDVIVEVSVEFRLR